MIDYLEHIEYAKYITVPNISVLVIVIVFLLFIWQAFKVCLLYRQIKKASASDDILGALKKTKVAPIAESYAETICIDITEKEQTNTPALELFSEFSTCSARKINLRLLDTGAGTLVGLGLLGTFLGLTLGIQGFDSSSTLAKTDYIHPAKTGISVHFLLFILMAM